MNLRKQLINLENNLAAFKATDGAPQQLIDLFNVLLAEAKKEHSGNPIVDSIKEIEPHGMTVSINAGGLKALAGQLATALPRSGGVRSI